MTSPKSTKAALEAHLRECAEHRSRTEQRLTHLDSNIEALWSAINESRKENKHWFITILLSNFTVLAAILVAVIQGGA